MGLGDQFHSRQCLESALSLAGFRGLGAETVHIRPDVGNFALLFLKG